MKTQIEKIVQAEWKVVLFADIIKDNFVKMMLEILNEAIKQEIDHIRLIKLYSKFTAAFIPKAANISDQGKNAWRNYILHLLLADENILSLQAEAQKYEEIPQPVIKMAESDLLYLQAIATFSGSMYRELLSAKTKIDAEIIETLPDWDGIYANKKEKAFGPRADLIAYFDGLNDWRQGLENLCSYYHEVGVGLFGKYHTLRWVRQVDSGKLVGARNTDPVRLDQLYEYEREQAKVIQNTEQFLRGYPANNVLLYGDRGTGKSSTIKAIINKYYPQGLRLIEIQKQDLADFPQVIALLANRPQKFILFVDDLSFNDNEGEYREMKALLEGGVESKPKNVLVYATSNRRHLVCEKGSDRLYTGDYADDDEIRRMDTLQEKLSLADRFGIAVTFSAPDQKRYLAIVEKLVSDRGLVIEAEELRQRAIKWELSFNARSARTARQFVDFLEGQLGIEKGLTNKN